MEGTPRNSLEGAQNTYCIGSSEVFQQLEEGVLHIWTWNLDVDQNCLSEHEELLSLEEWQRIRRFSSQRLARRFIVRRGMLRRILGHYLDQQPQGINFLYNPHGKPLLAPDDSTDLQFNLSDSADLAALAICLGQPVGIDIEQLRPVPLASDPDFFGFSLHELGSLEGASEPDRSLSFFRAWTRREAIAKAEGVGLQPLSGQFSFEDLADYMSPDSNAACTSSRLGFRLHQLALTDGYVGSLATRQVDCKIVYFSLESL